MAESPKIEHVLFVCGFLTEDIVRERGLPSVNAAGSNRSLRLAEALSAAGAEVRMLSSATTFRQKWRKRLFHPGRETSKNEIKVVFPWSLGLPVLGTLLEPLALVLSIKELFQTWRPTTVLLYNYYPGPLLAAVVAKYFYGSKMILEIEDVCVPRLSDWTGRGNARPVQQLVGRALLKVAIAVCDSVIVPSRRFLRVAGVNKRYAVISGCIAVDRAAARSAREPNGSLRILVGGTLDNQQGLGLVLEAIELLTRNRPVADRLDFNLCGFAQDERRLKEELQSLAAKGARVCYHGALRPDEYRALLAQTDVCLAMQNPHDQHSEAKTPSKVYEYLAHGKAVIVSDVGDFSELPSDVVSLCDWNAIALARRLEQFLGDAGIVQHMRERAVDYAVAEYALASNGAKILSSLAPDQNGPNADV